MSLQNLRLPDPLKVSGGNVADNWERFKDQWENYERAADLTDASAEKRAAVILTCLGGEAYDTYRSLALPAEDKKDIAKLTEAFETFCIGSVNVTYQRYLFYQRVQEANERFDTFLGEVRRMAKSCQFESMEESMIRDRVVVFVKDDATRHKLLQVRDLTLRKAIDICKASESAGQQLRAMAAQEHVQALQPSQTVRSRRSRPTASTPSKVSLYRCKYCGGTHEPRRELCPAYGQTCHRCSKKSHFGSVCLSTRPRSTRTKSEVCELDLEDDPDEELLTLNTPSGDRWYVRLRIDGHSVRLLLDSGATINLISKAIVHALGRSQDIRPTSKTLRMFDRTELHTSGVVDLTVEHPQTRQRHRLEFYVAESHEQSILGFHACKDLHLLSVDEAHVCALRLRDEHLTEETIVTEFPDLFDGLGHLQGDVHLQVNEKVPPVQMPLRRLPLSVRDKVGAELRRLEDLGVIESVSEPSPWISALLVVAKLDGRIRICMDPKPLNKAFLREQYCMPTINDILPQLANARCFSPCDLRDGFWHLSLDSASSRLTTFETPFGRERWLRLPFGISPSPEIFQSRVHAALSGLKGIACIADDILIYGAGETAEVARADHDQNLFALLRRCREQGIKLNRQKLRLYRQSTLFCGHELTPGGVRPDERKVDAIKHIPPLPIAREYCACWAWPRTLLNFAHSSVRSRPPSAPYSKARMSSAGSRTCRERR